jgi:hypothetical protein
MARRRSGGVSKKYDKAGEQGAEIVGKILSWTIMSLAKGTVALFKAITRKGKNQKKESRRR